jgi:hypothetical protein
MPTRRKKSRLPFETLDQTIEAMLECFFDKTNSSELFDDRDKLFRALLTFRKLNKNGGFVLQRDNRTRYYFYFHACLLRGMGPVRFLDGTFGVDVFSGSVGDGPRDPSRFNNTSPAQCISDRAKSARKLEEMADDVLMSRLTSYYPTDIPKNVNVRVGMLIGRCRYLTQRCSQSHAVARCTHCDARFFVFETTNNATAAASEDNNDNDDDSESDVEPDAPSQKASSGSSGPLHWDSVALHQIDLNQSMVCSLKCHMASKSLLERVLPDMFEIEQTRIGIHGVCETARNCIKRNAAYDRKLRLQRKSHQSAKAMAIMRRCEEMLDIDTALCLAAAKVADVRALTQEAIELPGEKMGWRYRRGCYVKQIERIKSIYNQGDGPNAPLVVDEGRLPKWVSRCVAIAPSLFHNDQGRV